MELHTLKPPSRPLPHSQVPHDVSGAGVLQLEGVHVHCGHGQPRTGEQIPRITHLSGREDKGGGYEGGDRSGTAGGPWGSRWVLHTGCFPAFTLRLRPFLYTQVGRKVIRALRRAVTEQSYLDKGGSYLGQGGDDRRDAPQDLHLSHSARNAQLLHRAAWQGGRGFSESGARRTARHILILDADVRPSMTSTVDDLRACKLCMDTCSHFYL